MKKDNYKIEVNDTITVAGQAERFRPTTVKLFYEKLRFKGGENLRNVDVTIESGMTAKKVRRIVEKRMCQAYYSRLGKDKPYGNQNRYYEGRAVSYQLHNIGQVENIEGVCRTERTHWKKRFDPITGARVFKPKMGYSTIEEAQEGAKREMERVHDKKDMPSVYKCDFCGKYHTGHIPQSRLGYKSVLSFADNMPAGQELNIAG